MKTENEIRAEVKKTIDCYRHVLDCGPATVQINAPRALMQVEACARLNALCFVLGTKRAKFKCDDASKIDR
jgi:hypothetical protein